MSCEMHDTGQSWIQNQLCPFPHHSKPDSTPCSQHTAPALEHSLHTPLPKHRVCSPDPMTPAVS